MTPDVQPSIAEPRSSRRHWYRFSLRSFLVFTTLVACLLGWVAKERSQSEFERQVGIQLQASSPKIQRHWQREWQRSTIVYLGPYDSLELHDENKPQGWWRDLARRILGERIFRIHSNSCVRQENFTLIVKLKNLEELCLNTIPVRHLTLLTGSENFNGLYVSGTTLIEKRVKSLQQALPNCRIKQ